MKKTVFVILLTVLAEMLLTTAVMAEQIILSRGVIPTTTYKISNLKQLEKLTDGITSSSVYSDLSNVSFAVDVPDAAFAEEFGEAAGYFEFDLGSVCTVEGYRMYNYRWPNQYCMNKSWRLYLSEDGEKWISAHYEADGSYDNKGFIPFYSASFKGIPARYARLSIESIAVGGTTDKSEIIKMYEFELLGTGEPKKEKNDAGMVSVSGDLLRQVAVSEALLAANIEWTPAVDLRTYNYTASREINITFKFYPGYKYKGPPYDRYMKGSSEQLLSFIDENGTYTGPTDNKLIPTMDCGSFVFNAIGRVAPVNAAAPEDYYNDKALYPLGEVVFRKTDNQDIHDEIVKRYTKEQIFEAYALVDNGDVLFEPHSKIITGGVTVVRRADGSIDGDKSYVVTSEEGTNTVQYYYINGSGETVHLKVSHPSAIESNPQNKLLYGTTLQVNRKSSFTQLYNSGFIALSLHAYHDNKTAAADVKYVNNITPESIVKNGLEGRIDSNYRLYEIVVTINRLADNGEVYRKVFYGERTFSYSMSTNAGEVNEKLKTLENGDYIIKVISKTGPVLTADGALFETELLNLSFSYPDGKTFAAPVTTTAAPITTTAALVTTTAAPVTTTTVSETTTVSLETTTASTETAVVSAPAEVSTSVQAASEPNSAAGKNDSKKSALPIVLPLAVVCAAAILTAVVIAGKKQKNIKKY